MIAVTSALVVPSISSVSTGSVEEETSRLRLVMRFAMEESQLSGMPLRWIATKDGWFFEALEQGELASKWVAYEDDPLVGYTLPQGVNITSVEQAGEFGIDMKNIGAENKRDGDNEKEVVAVLGTVLLLPDGTTSQSDIHLSGETESTILEVRPGPAGIKVKKKEE